MAAGPSLLSPRRVPRHPVDAKMGVRPGGVTGSTGFGVFRC